VSNRHQNRRLAGRFVPTPRGAVSGSELKNELGLSHEAHLVARRSLDRRGVFLHAGNVGAEPVNLPGQPAYLLVGPYPLVLQRPQPTEPTR